MVYAVAEVLKCSKNEQGNKETNIERLVILETQPDIIAAGCPFVIRCYLTVLKQGKRRQLPVLDLLK